MPLLAAALIKATLVLAFALLITRALRNHSAAARHLVWTCALLAALALPLVSFALPRWEVPLVQLDRTTSTPSQAASADAPSDRRATAMETRLRDRTGAADHLATAPPPRWPAAAGFSWTTVAIMAWAAGVVLLLGRLVAGMLVVRIMARRTQPAGDAAWVPLARDLAAELGITNVEFRRGRSGIMPIAWGTLRPVVMMPADAEAWPEDRLRIVLLHELAHVKRADCLTHILAQAACAIHWINPLAWTALRQARMERERACDDLVLACGTSDVHYADLLLEIARAMRATRFSAVMASASLAMAHRSQLEGRLMAILDRSVPRSSISRTRTVTAGACAFAALVPFAAVQPWAYAVVPHTPAGTRAVVAEAAPNAVRETAQKPTPRPVPTETAPVVSTAGLAGAVAGGIAGAVVGGVLDAVLESVPAAVAGALEQAGNQRPTPDPNPRPGRDERQEGKTADPRAIAALTAALKDSDRVVRETAMHALVQLRAPIMFEVLVEALKDPSADMRERAAFGLGQLDDKRAVAPLTAALKDTSASVREQVVFALGQIGDPSVTDALVIALKDESASVREQAAFALGQLGNKAAVDALIAAMKDASASVREQAAFALGQLRDARALDVLTAALKDASASVRQQAAFAIGQLAR